MSDALGRFGEGCRVGGSNGNQGRGALLKDWVL